MKSFTHKLIVALFAAAAFVAAADLATRAGAKPQGGAAVAPATEAKPAAEVKPAVVGVEQSADGKSVGISTAPISAFNGAATRNLSFRDGLEWTFGGKPQRGWALYVPLMRRLLETEGDAGTPEFAASLARWQSGAGLAPTGVLDDTTLYEMISAWQGVRIKDRSYPSADQLVVAPVSDFYDPTRPDELRQVERAAYAAYKRMVASAAQDPSLGLALTKTGELAPEEKLLKIISSFRSREYQEHLRRQTPNAGRAGLAVNSPHFTGRALDIYVGGDPVETKDTNRRLQVETRVYLWLVRNAEKFGFRPYYFEPWHWEYVGAPSDDKK